MDLPLIRPFPPRLSRLGAALEAIEESGIYSNSGPVARRFEQEATARLFGGRGACVAVANATLGLMLALRHGLLGRRDRTLAILPAFTFAATAHAAQWVGLTPVLADCDPDDWALAAAEEERLLARHGARIGAILPYATFGNGLDWERYAWLARRHDLAVVIDAAASLGARDEADRGFGTDCPFPVVFSMHATKTFATGEGGLIYCRDEALVERLRAMANFGFEAGRSATLPGLNAKLAEVPALLALEKLGEIEAVATHRAALADHYRRRLAGFTLQVPRGRRPALQFMPVLLPAALAPHREAIIARLAEAGIGAGRYFSPHLAEQPHFRDTCLIEPLPVTDAIASRMLVLPVTDAMTIADVDRVADALIEACRRQPRLPRAQPATPRSRLFGAILVGGGPAGSALIGAAAKAGQLEPLAAAGLAVIERAPHIGSGKLGAYAIASDSTAETFLTADTALPPALRLEDEAVAKALRAHIGGLGVPLAKVGAYLDRLGARLAQRLDDLGGVLLTGHEVVAAQQLGGGGWRVRARRRADGEAIELHGHSLVLATGGHQPATRLAEELVAGRSLIERCGDRLIQSDALLREGGVEAALASLPTGRPLRIALVGGSTSAVTAAVRLLKAGVPLAPGGLALLHRRPLRPFYPSAAAARADGFEDFGPDDICPVSGFVYRLAGFRLEARELVVHALGIGGRAGDPRLRLHRLGGAEDAVAARLLDEADLVVAAFGYRPHALPLIDQAGRAIRLRADAPAHGPMVDDQCRVVDAAGEPLDGVFGIGLAAGFVPSGALGGEPSFRGQANGLWLWQNDVGQRIAAQLLARAEAACARAVA
ncbi:DegT/DnrJ/EryC1/StrS family aminotransferase [Sphingomonas morindae]|uniref:DegT/DnrJ/EryC1/StrS family aminotransferase n=1 Tax=Sphingomonas morindae TaxID=1541170 RepID=A0ABY4XBP9_9SPHN|nr:DegT/DnrJ/EryC1/StrS family aminotransferase [Sphingomonas morindae]USI74181.1 DegT/DnrJ/EryC1/StrS family aminotransferase [Sphingomonas morindae]